MDPKKRITNPVRDALREQEKYATLGRRAVDLIQNTDSTMEGNEDAMNALCIKARQLGLVAPPRGEYVPKEGD